MNTCNCYQLSYPSCDSFALPAGALAANTAYDIYLKRAATDRNYERVAITTDGSGGATIDVATLPAYLLHPSNSPITIWAVLSGGQLFANEDITIDSVPYPCLLIDFVTIN